MIYKDMKNDRIYRDKGDFIRSGNAQIVQFQHYYRLTGELQECIDLLADVTYYADSITTEEEREQLNNVIGIVQKVIDSLLKRQHRIFDEFVNSDWASRIKEGSIIEMEEKE